MQSIDLSEQTPVAVPAPVDHLGWLLAVATTFAGAIVTPLVRGAVVGGMNPITLLLLRLLLTVVLTVGAIGIFDRRHLQIDRQGFWRLGVVGLISGVEICCFFWSLAFVDASMSAMIKSTQPLVVLLLLALRGEQLRGRHWLRLGFATAGIYFLVGPGGHVETFGLFLLTLSLILYALQLVLIQWWLKDYHNQTTTFYLTSIMTLVIIVWWWLQDAGWQDPGLSGWVVIAILAVVSTYLARLALFAAIRRLGSGQIALLWPLQTLLVIVLSVLFLQERMAPLQWFGGSLVLISALLAIEQWPQRISRQAKHR
jgi:drug/metabolite transporter (DMT)-like permease